MKIQEAFETVLDLADSAALDVNRIGEEDHMLVNEARRQAQAISIISDAVTPQILRVMEFIHQSDIPVKINITM